MSSQKLTIENISLLVGTDSSLSSYLARLHSADGVPRQTANKPVHFIRFSTRMQNCDWNSSYSSLP